MTGTGWTGAGATPARALMKGLLVTGLAFLVVFSQACRGGEGKNGEQAYIAIHEDVREALAAFEAEDENRLRRALGRLGEISERPELLGSPELIEKVRLSRGGRYLVLGFGRSLGGSKLLVLEARSGRLLLGMRGYGESFSADDRWLACLQHRYATPNPGADVGAYEALMLVDLGRVRGAAIDDATVFRTIVQDPDARLMGAQTAFIADDRIRVTRIAPPLEIIYSFDGEEVVERGRRWKYLKLF